MRQLSRYDFFPRPVRELVSTILLTGHLSRPQCLPQAYAERYIWEARRVWSESRGERARGVAETSTNRGSKLFREEQPFGVGIIYRGYPRIFQQVEP